MGRKRARTDSEKADKKKRILDSAWKLFSESGGELPTASNIAEAAGIAKGTVYVYFRTKEEIYLALFPEKLQEWADDAEEAMARIDTGDINQIAGALTRFPLENPMLMKFGSILLGVLEENASDEAIIDMKIRAAKVTQDMSARLCRRLPWLSPTEGSGILMSIYALLRGLWQHASIPERLRKKLVEANSDLYEMDLSRTVIDHVAALLEGFRVRS